MLFRRGVGGVWVGYLHEVVGERIARVMVITQSLIGGRELVDEAIRDTPAWRERRLGGGDDDRVRSMVAVE